MREILSLVLKNIKFRFREPQQFIFIFGFPVMFVFVFWFMFSQMMIDVHTQFDLFIWGLLGFSTAFATQSASVAFSQEKDRGTLRRLFTTPVASTGYIFAGFIVSEVIIIVLQLLTVYILAFLALGVYFYSIGALLVNFGMYLILGLFCIGVGLIMAALLNAKLAGQLPMLVIMPLVFLSGIFVPFSSPILYVNPVFWACSFAKEIGFFGKDLFGTIEILDYTSQGLIDSGITIVLCIPITVIFAVAFLLVGLLLFKRKLQE